MTASADSSREWEVRCGDALDLLAELPAESVDGVLCDPPYGLDLAGAGWDGVAIRESAAIRTGRQLDPADAFTAWTTAWATAALGALKPGGHLLAFGGARTFHRLAVGLEHAGLELRDTLSWLYGTSVSKSRRLPGGRATTLRPGWEPIVIARRPLATDTTMGNVARYGTGALNVGACRVGGRHPANVITSHAEDCTPGRCAPGCPLATGGLDDETLGDAGRLFFVPKADRAERDAGCEHLAAGAAHLLFEKPRRRPGRRGVHNPHPTIKPIALMRWLCRLACPPGGLVLDPFCGSGSTGVAAVLEGRRFLGVEIEPAYVEISAARIGHWQRRREQGAERVPLARRAGRRPR